MHGNKIALSLGAGGGDSAAGGNNGNQTNYYTLQRRDLLSHLCHNLCMLMVQQRLERMWHFPSYTRDITLYFDSARNQ